VARVTGRSDDMLIIRGVNVFLPDRGDPAEERQALAALRARSPPRRTLDDLDVLVERRVEMPAAAKRRSDGRRADHQGTIGVSTKVRVRRTGHGAAFAGQGGRVIDKRRKLDVH